MITNVSIISIFCTDLDETRDFYVDVLGFDAAEDISFGDYRWVTVTHPEQPELYLHITTPGPPLDDNLVDAIQRSLAAGTMTGIGLRVEDCRATYEELSAKGVTFLQEPPNAPTASRRSCVTSPATGWCWSSRSPTRRRTSRGSRSTTMLSARAELPLGRSPVALRH